MSGSDLDHIQGKRPNPLEKTEIKEFTKEEIEEMNNPTGKAKKSQEKKDKKTAQFDKKTA